MTTYDDDFLRLHLLLGTMDLPVPEAGFEWPPPERIVINDPKGDGPMLSEATADSPVGNVLLRTSYSQISDDDRAGMDMVLRGADYHYEDMWNGDANVIEFGGAT